jgi:hypothetical protein
MAKAAAKTKKPPARKPWSKDDVRLLKGMARKEPASKIAKALKRTEGATRQKATALSISLNLSQEGSGRQEGCACEEERTRQDERSLRDGLRRPASSFS